MPPARNGTAGWLCTLATTRHEHDSPHAARAASSERSRRVEKMPAAHERVEPLRLAAAAGQRGVEEQVGVARAHPLAVEAVAQAVADGERVVADVPVERESMRRHDPLGERRRRRGKKSSPSVHGTSPSAGAHAAASSREQDEHGLDRSRSRSASRSTIPQSKKTRVGNGSGSTSQTGPPSRLRAPSATRAMRSASDAPSRPWKRSASARRSARGPTLDAEHRDRPGRRARGAARRRARRRARGPRARRRGRAARSRRATRGRSG